MGGLNTPTYGPDSLQPESQQQPQRSVIEQYKNVLAQLAEIRRREAALGMRHQPFSSNADSSVNSADSAIQWQQWNELLQRVNQRSQEMDVIMKNRQDILRQQDEWITETGQKHGLTSAPTLLRSGSQSPGELSGKEKPEPLPYKIRTRFDRNLKTRYNERLADNGQWQPIQAGEPGYKADLVGYHSSTPGAGTVPPEQDRAGAPSSVEHGVSDERTLSTMAEKVKDLTDQYANLQKIRLDIATLPQDASWNRSLPLLGPDARQLFQSTDRAIRVYLQQQGWHVQEIARVAPRTPGQLIRFIDMIMGGGETMVEPGGSGEAMPSEAPTPGVPFAPSPTAVPSSASVAPEASTPANAFFESLSKIPVIGNLIKSLGLEKWLGKKKEEVSVKKESGLNEESRRRLENQFPVLRKEIKEMRTVADANAYFAKQSDLKDLDSFVRFLLQDDKKQVKEVERNMEEMYSFILSSFEQQLPLQVGDGTQCRLKFDRLKHIFYLEKIQPAPTTVAKQKAAAPATPAINP